MAFVTAGGDNPLEGVDDGMYSATISAFDTVENKFYGKLFQENKPEGPDNRPSPHKTQYEITFAVDVGEDEPVEAKKWVNPTLGEKANLRKIVKAAGAWVEDGPGGKPGFDDENMVGRKLKVLVQDGRLDNFLKAS